ncbi:hypothetical protein [Sandaracinus amylolyticus]|uniref:Lipoprotein n=1 Tax=Sandaracinus amylolyticus TaxID=927083 RepID=A0A0F6W268_9BACT|nr:hypothetical protein [Sandaracinus amylolyticus]AKF05581.1 hypothetical protein DB32_002730 [Sandaracinus amylolyticus]
MPTDHVRATCALVLAGALSIACEERDPAPFAPERDGAIERPDGGPLVITRRDAGQRDAGIDAGAFDGGDLGDAGVGLPVVDGVIGEREYELGIDDVTSSTPPTGLPDQLTRLLVVRTATRLWIGIEGNVGPGRGMMLLLDAAYGGEDGVTLTAGSLADNVGTLDRALSSAVLFSAEDSFRPEYAWGALAEVPFTIDGSEDDVGWREITTADDFADLPSGNRTVCSEDACETSIPIGGTGILRAGTIAIAVRTIDANGLLSSQTLPLDEPGAPESISNVLRVFPPE